MYDLEPSQWRGRHLATRKDSSGKRHTAVAGSRGMLFTPVEVEPYATYRIHMEIRRESGDGRLCCNLFANRNYDFPQVVFNCEGEGWTLYDITLRAGDFPPNLPIVLRLWRPKGGTGTVLVRRMAIEKIAEPGEDSAEVRAVASSARATTAAAGKTRPGHRKLGGQPPSPNPDAVKRVKVSKDLEQARAQQRRARRRKLGAPTPRARRERRKRRGRRQSSSFNWSPARVMLIMGDAAQLSVREKAFKTAGFSTHAFCVGREQGRGLETRLDDFKPTWVHIVLDGPRPPDALMVDVVRRKASNAIITAWLPSDEFSGPGSAVLKHADLALVGGGRAQASYRGSGVPASQWREGASESERKQAVLDLGRRLGFMEVLAKDFAKDRIKGAFRRLLCFVPSGSPALFAASSTEMSVRFLPFVDCDDFEEQAMRYKPDWIHIHCEQSVRLPWKQALQDLRRKLPRTLVTAWHAGSSPPDPGFLGLAEGADHMLVGDASSLPAHIAEGMVHAFHWVPSSDPSSAEFVRDMESLAPRLREHRQGFLLNHEGKRVDMTVFIGTYNRLDKLRTAVSCAFASAGSRTMEVIVNDAGSTDGTVEWLKKKAAEDPRVVLILSGKRTSFTQAFNESLRIAKGRYICWLSDDIMARNNTMEDMCSLMDALRPLDMGAFPIWNSWSKRLSYTLRSSRGYLCPTVGCMYTETMRRINGINIDYPYYGQDTELDYRVLRIGGSIVECQTAQLDHMCDLDELRRTNIKKHETMSGGDKFEVASQKLERCRHQYPAILLLLKDGAAMERAEQAAAGIRRHYSNSDIYVASDPPAPARGVLSMKRAPVPSGEKTAKFDIVIHLRPDQHRLVEPRGKNNLPFVRGLIS